tara:strand:+ start:388 stop:492 length:105 start_codon:yes stop_codon:yes gene_type:complete
MKIIEESEIRLGEENLLRRGINDKKMWMLRNKKC